MGKNLFSVPIFFIVFREALEGALILAILLGLAHQIGYNTRSASPTRTTGPGNNCNTELNGTSAPRDENGKIAGGLARKLKIQASWLCFDMCISAHAWPRSCSAAS